MRENKLRQHTSFVDELGRAQSEGDQIRSTKEAKRLAFDIFWNARTDYSRSSPPTSLPHTNLALSFVSKLACRSSNFTELYYSHHFWSRLEGGPPRTHLLILKLEKPYFLAGEQVAIIFLFFANCHR
jgi:hypothetical protein